MITVKTPADSLIATLDWLSGFESESFPVVSLYLDARPDSRGRDHYKPFVRKELVARQRTYALRSPERKSFEADVEKIQRYLETEVKPSANGIAIFACSGEGDFFEALQLEPSFEENRLSVAKRPQVFLLARLIDENPRYALVLADTRSARIFAVARGARIDEKELERPTRPRPYGTGSSQMRYQRHVEHLVQEHVRELVERLGHVVHADRVDHILLAGDEVIVALIRAELPKRLAQKVVDTLHVDKKKPEAEIFSAAEEVLRELDSKSDTERVDRLIGEYRAGGLAVVGLEEVRRALELGQADELLISASLDRTGPAAEQAAADFVALARRTGTRVTFIEDPKLLAEVEGVGAFLRYKPAPVAETA